MTSLYNHFFHANIRWSLQREPSPGAQSLRASTMDSSTTDLQQSESGAQGDGDPGTSPPRPKRQRTLMLLSRSRGVQTDPTENEDYLSALPHSSAMRRPGGGHSKGPSLSETIAPSVLFTDHTSETSSISGMASASAPLPELIERLSALLTRLNQTTVETLTARLKRQNLLAGSDISHLSKSTIAHIQNDVAQLRTHFKSSLEVEKVLEMTRKDLRNLLRFAKDMFSEMGRLKAVVNDVTMDPSNAARVLATASAKLENPNLRVSSSPGQPSEIAQKDRGWIAPITKLFAPTAADSGEASGSGGGGLRESPVLGGSGANPSSSSGGGGGTTVRRRPPPRPVPKLAAAVSSSTTTVNVEFASSRSRRAVSSTAIATSSDHEGAGASGTHSLSSTMVAQKKPRRDDLLGIFAGAPPKPEVTAGESWVVLPRDVSARKLRTSASTAKLDGDRTAEAGRARRGRHRMSRNVDAIVDNIGQRHGIIGEEDESAIIDDEEDGVAGAGDLSRDGDDFQQTILERTRTLRPRGLSDSSIRSTFLASGGDDASGYPVNRLLTPASLALSSADTSTTAMGLGVSFGAFDRQNVLKSLGKRMQSLASYYVPGGVSTSDLPNQSEERTPDDQDPSSSSPSSVSRVDPATLPPRSPPRDIPSSARMSSPYSPVNSPVKRRPRTATGVSTGSPSTSSPGRIPVLSNILAAVVDADWSDSDQTPHHHRRAQEDWARRDRF